MASAAKISSVPLNFLPHFNFPLVFLLSGVVSDVLVTASCLLWPEEIVVF